MALQLTGMSRCRPCSLNSAFIFRKLRWIGQQFLSKSLSLPCTTLDGASLRNTGDEKKQEGFSSRNLAIVSLLEKKVLGFPNSISDTNSVLSRTGPGYFRSHEHLFYHLWPICHFDGVFSALPHKQVFFFSFVHGSGVLLGAPVINFDSLLEQCYVPKTVKRELHLSGESNDVSQSQMFPVRLVTIFSASLRLTSCALTCLVLISSLSRMPEYSRRPHRVRSLKMMPRRPTWSRWPGDEKMDKLADLLDVIYYHAPLRSPLQSPRQHQPLEALTDEEAPSQATSKRPESWELKIPHTSKRDW